jgi:hypothetical protein
MSTNYTKEREKKEEGALGSRGIRPLRNPLDIIVWEVVLRGRRRRLFG